MNVLPIFFSGPSFAHIMMEGAGELANGALHPLMTPAHVLILLGAGLLCGQQGGEKDLNPLPAFAPASAAALAVTLAAGLTNELWLPLVLGVALVLAGLVAAAPRLPRAMVIVLTIIAGVVIGLDSPAETGDLAAKIKTLAGTWVSANAVVFYLAACASNAAGRPWAMTGIRILGSWVVAIALMVLAFSLRK